MTTLVVPGFILAKLLQHRYRYDLQNKTVQNDCQGLKNLVQTKIG